MIAALSSRHHLRDDRLPPAELPPSLYAVQAPSNSPESTSPSLAAKEPAKAIGCAGSTDSSARACRPTGRPNKSDARFWGRLGRGDESRAEDTRRPALRHFASLQKPRVPEEGASASTTWRYPSPPSCCRSRYPEV